MMTIGSAAVPLGYRRGATASLDPHGLHLSVVLEVDSSADKADVFEHQDFCPVAVDKRAKSFL